MIHIMGELALILALIFATIQCLLPLFGFYRNNPYLLAFARPCSDGQFFFVLLAYGILTLGFILNDFSIAYIAANSHPTLPLMYQLTAPWGGHEGSVLLWILILNVWAFIYNTTQPTNVSSALVLAIMGLISAAFLIFLIFTSNPFMNATVMENGHDLNPLLQDPGFIIHPPILYVGYVGLSAAFAITQASLIQDRLDRAWAKLTRQFTIAAWCFLTAGIMLGSWWAYRVLGWGGFWFWDPVENASLLPWLSATAFIHVLLLVEKRQIATSFAVFLSILCFALSLLGTFLVRSGVLISAHTFANDPSRGIFLLILLGILITLALFVCSKHHFKQAPVLSFNFLSKETMLLANSGFLFIAMLTILLGTLYPLMLDALRLEPLSVGAPYFNEVLTPIVLITMIFMALAPFCSWQKEFKNTLAIKKILQSLLFSFIILTSLHPKWSWLSFCILTLSIFIILSVFTTIRKHMGMSVAHIGFAVFIIGVSLSSLLNEEREVRLKPGTSTHIGPYQFFFIETKSLQGPNYRAIQAQFEVLKNANFIAYLYPEKRIYTIREMIMTKVAIHPDIFRDLYIALGEPLQNNDWSVRIYYKPFIRFIWLGGLLMIVGGFLTLRKNHES